VSEKTVVWSGFDFDASQTSWLASKSSIRKRFLLVLSRGGSQNWAEDGFQWKRDVTHEPQPAWSRG
jgi:hypothetical protein